MPDPIIWLLIGLTGIAIFIAILAAIGGLFYLLTDDHIHHRLQTAAWLITIATLATLLGYTITHSTGAH